MGLQCRVVETWVKWTLCLPSLLRSHQPISQGLSFQGSCNFHSACLSTIWSPQASSQIGLGCALSVMSFRICGILTSMKSAMIEDVSNLPSHDTSHLHCFYQHFLKRHWSYHNYWSLRCTKIERHLWLL